MQDLDADSDFTRRMKDAADEALRLINEEKKTDFTYTLYFFKGDIFYREFEPEADDLQIMILNDLSDNFSAWHYAITVYPEDYIEKNGNNEIVFCIYTKKYHETFFYNKPLFFDKENSKAYFSDKLILKDKQLNPFYLCEPKKWWQWWRLLEKTH